MKKTGWVAVLAIAGAAVAMGGAYALPYWFATKQTAKVDIHDAALIARGAVVARQGDCIACHTAPGGKPFAGGLAMQTPVGAIYSTNITPDPMHGIGLYDYGDFERAVRQGVRRDGTPLYPAMPYVSYAVVKDEDVKALYAWVMTQVPAVAQDNHAATIPWPMNMRWPLAWWQYLFAGQRRFEPSPHLDAQQQRGAYLVEGLAHCGACHTPRGIAYQEKALKDEAGGAYLSGSVLEGWYAKNLRNEAVGLASWPQADIADFLKTGRTASTAAFGSMADVVEHSTQHMSDADLQAIAAYLKALAPRPGYPASFKPGADTTTVRLLKGDYAAPGAVAYVENCASCHGLDGRGAPRIFPALAGNTIVRAEDPSSLIQVTLAGSTMAHTPADRMRFEMPGFDQLDNRTVADIVTFIRAGWGNGAAAVGAKDVSQMREIVARKPENYVPVTGDAK